MIRRRALALLLVAATYGLCFATPETASAAITSGWVTGTILYRERNLNFCDTTQGQDCTGAAFTDANAGTDRPIRRAVVNVRDEANSIIGTGSTDNNGNFLIAWSSSVQPQILHLTWTVAEKTNKFAFYTTSGLPQVLHASTSRDLVPNGGTQSFGINTWTNSSLANTYAAALWTRESLGEYAGLDQIYTGVQILAFFALNQAGPLGVCNTSCANRVNGVPMIQLDAQSLFVNQARIQHEMGHLASYMLNPRQQVGDYCWPDTLGAAGCQDSDGDGFVQPGSWNQNSGEWMNAAFEEGFATFLGDRVIYGQNATEPTTCFNAAGPCDPTQRANQTEFTNGLGNLSACGLLSPTTTPDPLFLRRGALNVDRYLRDIYDNSNDSTACPAGDATCQRGRSFNDTMTQSFAEMMYVITRFPEGTANNQDSEPFDGAGNVDNRDGFSSVDYRDVYKNIGAPSVDTSLARTYACDGL